MKYFTRDLYEGYQPRRSKQEQKAASHQWDLNLEEYARHWDAIRARMPPGVLWFTEHVVLHDARIVSIWWCRGGALRFRFVDACHMHRPFRRGVIEFQDVREFACKGAIPGEEWLYQEYDVAQDGGFRLSLLLTSAELSLTARDMKVDFGRPVPEE